VGKNLSNRLRALRGLDQPGGVASCPRRDITTAAASPVAINAPGCASFRNG
jgi:hypothetical protein